MRDLWSLFLGIIMGLASAFGFTLWRSDVEVSELGDKWREHVDNAVEAGRQAAAAKEKELLAEIAEMSGDNPQGDTNV